jgi:hypothetical protein
MSIKHYGSQRDSRSQEIPSKETKKNASKQKGVPYKVDRSPAARAFARAVKLTHKRLYGEP